MRSVGCEARSRTAASLPARGSLWPAGVWMVWTPTPSGWCWSGPRASISMSSARLTRGEASRGLAARGIRFTMPLAGGAQREHAQRARTGRGAWLRRQKPRERMQARGLDPEAATASALPGRWPRTGVLRHREESRSKTCGASGRRHLTRRSTGFFQLVTSFSALDDSGEVQCSPPAVRRAPFPLPRAAPREHASARDSGMSEIPLRSTLSEPRGRS
jgi:hypothetical protein